MINPLKDIIYDTFRSAVFSIIYPAPSIFSPRTRNYLGARGLANLIPNIDNSRHLVYFDLNGNMYTSDMAVDIAQPGIFEAVIIKNSNDTSLYNKDIQYIIFIGGNTTCVEILLPEMLECYYKNNQQVCVIGFNPPGVGMSPGIATFETNCAAPEAIVKHLLDRIPANNISIIGHSLGGSYGAHVAAKYQLRGKNIRVFIDRAMSSISDAAVAKVLRSVPTLLLRNTIGLLLAFITRILIKILHLDIDLVKNFVTINTKNPGAAHAMVADGDEMMLECCLLDKLPSEHEQYAEKFELHPKDKNRKSHSVQRELLYSKTQPNKTAEHYLAKFIQDFSKHSSINKKLTPS